MRPGGHQLRPELVAHHQRRRIIDGAAEVIAERGYREVSVADIVKAAAIARGRFYEHFSSKEDCFFAVYEEGTAAALAAVSEGCGKGGEDLGLRLEAGLSALLAYLEANPAMARCCIVEGPAVGAAIGGRFEAAISSFAGLLRAARAESGDGEDLPATVEETVVGGLYWQLYYALLEGRPKRIGRLLPQLSDFASIPFAAAAPQGASLR